MVLSFGGWLMREMLVRFGWFLLYTNLVGWAIGIGAYFQDWIPMEAVLFTGPACFVISSLGWSILTIVRWVKENGPAIGGIMERRRR